jgi:hypothetical protein
MGLMGYGCASDTAQEAPLIQKDNFQPAISEFHPVQHLFIFQNIVQRKSKIDIQPDSPKYRPHGIRLDVDKTPDVTWEQ